MYMALILSCDNIVPFQNIPFPHIRILLFFQEYTPGNIPIRLYSVVYIYYYLLVSAEKEMDTFIKYIFIYQYCIYTFFHLIKQKYLYQSRRSFLFLLTICLSSLTYLFRKSSPVISDTIPITLLWIILSLLTSSPKISYIATILSFGISYGIFAVSSSLILLLFMPVYYQSEHFPYVFFMLAVGILGS